MKKTTKGFFIIEALVSLLIFSVGILAVLEIQVNTMNSHTNAQLRTNATQLAEELVTYIQSDVINAQSYISGSATNYNIWLENVKKTMPGSEDKMPTIEMVDSDNLIITIYWKNKGSSLYSKHEVKVTLL